MMELCIVFVATTKRKLLWSEDEGERKVAALPLSVRALTLVTPSTRVR